MGTPEPEQHTEAQEPVPAVETAPAAETPPETQEAAPQPESSLSDEQAGQLPQDRNLPVGQAVGGSVIAASEPDLAPELANPTLPGEGHDSLAYDKHSTEAITEDGNPVRIVVAHPVRVDGTNRRSDDDALEGQKCKVIAGDYKDRKGVFLSVERYDPSTGYPVQVLVRTSDDENQLISVPYASVRPDLSQR